MKGENAAWRNRPAPFPSRTLTAPPSVFATARSVLWMPGSVAAVNRFCAGSPATEPIAYAGEPRSPPGPLKLLSCQSVSRNAPPILNEWLPRSIVIVS